MYTTDIDGQLVLFGQDVHGPIHSELLSDEKQYLASLARLLNLEADLLLEGHFGIIETKQEVREFIEYWRSSGATLYTVSSTNILLKFLVMVGIDAEVRTLRATFRI